MVYAAVHTVPIALPLHTQSPSQSLIFLPPPTIIYTPGSSSLSHPQYPHTPLSINHHPSHTHTTHLSDAAGGYRQKYTLSVNPFEVCTVVIFWVDQHHENPLLHQILDCLQARVVKHSCLPDRETIRAQYDHFLWLLSQNFPG